MVYNTQNCWVSKNQKTRSSGYCIRVRPQVKEGDTCSVGSLSPVIEVCPPHLKKETDPISER
jgi:hypothetical protein